MAALDHATGVVLGQIAVDTKSNEIPAAKDLLAAFDTDDLQRSVITVDAMHTQTDTAELILEAGADYVFTVKANQPKLLAALKKLPWAKMSTRSQVTERGHGRRVTRTIKVAQAPAWIGFPTLAQVAQVRRTVTRQGKNSVEVVYLITSADYHNAPPATLASWIQGHWRIENPLHWVRDVTYDQDRSQVRTGSAPHVMASLGNTVIRLLRLTGCDNITAAQQHHTRDPQGTVTWLPTY